MSNLAEQALIGSLMVNLNSIGKIYDIIKPYMFRDQLLGEIYKEIVKRYDIGEHVNAVAVVQSIESETFTREIIGQTILDCSAAAYMPSQIVSYAKSVVKEYKARALRERLSKVSITAAGVDAEIAELMQDLEALKKSEKIKGRKLEAIVKDYQEQYFKEQQIEKLYTGFPKLDDLTGGLEGGDVIIIGARPGVGKSAFVSQVILQMARGNKKVGFYNLEMSDKQIYERLLSHESGLKLNRIRKAKQFLGGEQETFEKANKQLEGLSILISSGTKTVSQIRNECRHQELDVIIIDYLQLVRADVKYQNRTSEVGAISKAIKALAMELNIPIIALSQLNRTSEARETKEPTMGELRETGDIEQDASIIILMWNIGNDKERKGLKIDKNRQGELGKIVYRFDGSKMKFVETDETIKGSRFSDKFVTPFDD